MATLFTADIAGFDGYHRHWSLLILFDTLVDTLAGLCVILKDDDVGGGGDDYDDDDDNNDDIICSIMITHLS